MPEALRDRLLGGAARALDRLVELTGKLAPT